MRAGDGRSNFSFVCFLLPRSLFSIKVFLVLIQKRPVRFVSGHPFGGFRVVLALGEVVTNFGVMVIAFITSSHILVPDSMPLSLLVLLAVIEVRKLSSAYFQLHSSVAKFYRVPTSGAPENSTRKQLSFNNCAKNCYSSSSCYGFAFTNTSVCYINNVRMCLAFTNSKSGPTFGVCKDRTTTPSGTPIRRAVLAWNIMIVILLVFNKF